MNRPTTVAIALMLTLAVQGAAQVSDHLTLDEAIRLGRERSRTLKVSAAKVDAAQAKADEVSTALLPAVRAEANYKRASEVDPFQIQFPGAPQPTVISPVVLNNYNVAVGVSQPIFLGFRLRSNARAAASMAEVARSDYRSSEADLVLGITAAYWTLHQTRETTRLTRQNVERLTRYVEDVEKLMKAGLATTNDLLKIQVQLSSARLTLIDATIDARLALMNLNNVIGRPLEADVELTSAPGLDRRDAKGLPEDPLAPAIDRAFDARPELEAMHYRIEASKEGVTAAQAGWWPQLALVGSYLYSRPNPRIFPTRDMFIGTWEVGLRLQWDVWTWMTPAYQTEQAVAMVRQNELQLEQMKENISLEVHRSALGLRRAREKVEVAELGVQQAEENLRSTTEKFKNGLATSTDLLDADVAALQSRTSLTGALVEFEMARATFVRATGMLE